MISSGSLTGGLKVFDIALRPLTNSGRGFEAKVAIRPPPTVIKIEGTFRKTPVPPPAIMAPVINPKPPSIPIIVPTSTIFKWTS